MSDECRRCHKVFDSKHKPDPSYPHLCGACVIEIQKEMAEAEKRLEVEALDYDLFERCPEL
ncbi:MAG: hypothetical protein KKE73_09610 [Proteobacteria bacterium]|nr:hypothetical protein [Pseudomonadota bacterium]